MRAIKHIGSAHKKKANDFGFLAVVAMSYFLIPVSRQSVIMEALGIGSGSAHATRLHVWAGIIALFGGLAHGLYYCWLWFIHENKSLDEIVPFPSDKCWRWDYGSPCRKKFVNLLGLSSGTIFLIMGSTSIWLVRRRFFRVFYFAHIGCSFILMFLLAMHYNKMILYLAPSLVYYFASNVPQWVEWIWKWIKGGTAIASFVEIPDSGGCVELSLRMPDQASSSLCGKFIRLAVPSISSKSHPFSCFVGYPPTELNLMFRCRGRFTKQLSKKLSKASSTDSISYPTVVVNGMRSGTNQWRHAMQHDTVVIFAGGVGIVTYISLLSFMASLSTPHDELENTEETCKAIRKRRKVCVHWACRDEGLIDYVSEKYIATLQELSRARTSNIEMKVVIHHTSTTPREAVVAQNGNFGASENDMSKSQLPIASSFESGDSIRNNLISGIAFGLIGIGGCIIITYCYGNIQNKHVVETRLIAIVALIVWSIVVATVVYVAKRLSTCIPSKGSYSKLSKGVEIEFTELGESSQSDANAQPEIEDSDRNDELAANEESGEKSWMTVLHEDERPNLKVSIQEAAERPSDEIQHLSVGVFACGPNSLIDAIRTTADSLNKGRKTDTKIAVDVYDEIFEL
eukprot:CAMPEP_0113606614 /NCGR_PEP_ID=MMETSP0017_2-20120614/2949_1 /TAXON_ID=2856 /ORGANISM="Cylindrotheca closterium" /LENGTH=626 /DNA_ID=CAMNT_0000515171 /DNA_START=443 /DNA_END=2323 /DNA_ORIENTATION=+ /assembly_acc=CAM_ASM_000147